MHRLQGQCGITCTSPMRMGLVAVFVAGNVIKHGLNWSSKFVYLRITIAVKCSPVEALCTQGMTCMVREAA